MSIARFKFYANGHDKPHTGHVHLSHTEEGGWRLTSNHIRVRETTTLEGTGDLNGGRAFLEEMHHFIAYWAVAQSDAIEKHRLWSSSKPPTSMLVRPGFRAVSAEKQWHSYVRDTKRESAMIQADYEKAQKDLYLGGWCAAPDETPFPTFIFGDPWNTKLDTTAKSTP